MEQTAAVQVSDFGALADTPENAAPGIMAAVAHAHQRGIRRVQFAPGTYRFDGLSGWEGRNREGSCYMALENLRDIELAGAVDAAGQPATRWVVANDLQEGQPTIMSIERSRNVTVRNLVVDMDPWYYSAGRVTAIAGDDVTIELLPGHPQIDGQPMFNMGTYDLEQRKALVLRLSWDFDLPVWHTVGAADSRIMRTSYANLAQNVQAGQAVFWFQGNYCGPLLHFGHIHNLLVENVRILGGHGFTMTCNYCHDVTYRQVRLEPGEGRIASSCRDGFKLYCPSGKLLMDGMRIEGCLGDDGQNVHGMWLAAKETRGSHTLLATAQWREDLLTPGKCVRLLDDHFLPGWESTVAACRYEGQEQLITFTDPLPEWVHERTPIEPQEWLPDSLHITNSVFRSTGRFGVYLKASNTLIENCLFENNVAGIHIGGEWSWGYWLESTNSQHVEIRNCTFRDNTLDMRYGGHKMDRAISVASWTARHTPGLMQDIRIHDNTFEDEVTCVNLANCRRVWFWNNKLVNCARALVADAETTDQIYEHAPEEEA
ncbi:MAG: right-handed parallel beta-helix repeat-containing protein [Anaerolineae bacterium]